MRYLLLLLLLGGCADISIRDQIGQTVLLQSGEMSCSGTVVNVTDVLTAEHCLSISAVAIEGESSHLRVRVVKKSEDLILLRFTGTFAHRVILADKRDRPRVGDRIRVVGCPTGICGIVSDGYIAQLGDELVVSAAVYPGGSGGGVFWKGRRGWRQIGVVQAVRGSPHGKAHSVTLASPQKAIAELMASKEEPAIPLRL